MSVRITLDVPEEFYEALCRKAAEVGHTPEQEAASRLLSETQTDPLIVLAGVVESGPEDVADRHDEYLGKRLVQKLSR